MAGVSFNGTAIESIDEIKFNGLTVTEGYINGEQFWPRIQTPQIIYITQQSKVNGNFNLRTIYNNTPLTKSPKSGDIIIFLQRENITILGDSPSKPTVETGSWPTGVQLIYQMEDNTVIAGRGGQGGKASTKVGTKFTYLTFLPIPVLGLYKATLSKGGNGGVAVSATYPIKFERVGAGVKPVIGGGSGGDGATYYESGNLVGYTNIDSLSIYAGNGGAFGGAGGVVTVTGGNWDEGSITHGVAGATDNASKLGQNGGYSRPYYTKQAVGGLAGNSIVGIGNVDITLSDFNLRGQTY